jgi:zinc transport system ATP-binding protein
METAIKITNLKVCYDNNCVLNNVNLQIEEGEFLGVIGPNGGGKTTLAKVILGIKEASQGNVLIYGMTPKKARGMVGYVPQFTTFEKDFPISVEEVVLTGMLGKVKPFRKYGSQEFLKADSIMERVGIKHLKKNIVKTLSGGEIQKMLLARALIAGPKILILDEPTASVDTNAKDGIYDLLKELNNEMTIMLITHDLGVVSAYVKSIACVNIEVFYHGESEINENIIEHTFGCPVDLLAHGVPHRVLRPHKREGGKS